jgi:MraZ protein
LNSVGENRVFITSLNVSTAFIYPLSVWRENERMLSEPGEDADLRADVAMIANHYGEDTEIDGQGRVLLPTTLRRDLQLEKDDVHLLCYKGRIEVFGSQVYEARLAKAKSNAAEKQAALEKKGLR